MGCSASAERPLPVRAGWKNVYHATDIVYDVGEEADLDASISDPKSWVILEDAAALELLAPGGTAEAVEGLHVGISWRHWNTEGENKIPGFGIDEKRDAFLRLRRVPPADEVADEREGEAKVEADGVGDVLLLGPAPARTVSGRKSGTSGFTFSLHSLMGVLAPECMGVGVDAEQCKAFVQKFEQGDRLGLEVFHVGSLVIKEVRVQWTEMQ